MLQSHNMDVRSTDARPTGPEMANWRWDAVQSRDRRADGRFVYAVTSTGVFCRPSCPSRVRGPTRRFFDSGAARGRRFRACRRCRPTIAERPAEAIARAPAFLAAHADETVSLSTLARVAKMSPFHLQRQFKKALSSRRASIQAACRADRFRRELRAGRDVPAAIYEAGYGSPSRVYEASPTGRGMAPATYRRGGAETRSAS